MELASIRSQITAAGLKATHQRMVVFENLAMSREHPTVDRIYEEIREKTPSISVATIYRVLEDLVKVGLVHKVSSKQGTMRYDANTKPHNHIYCTNTHDIIDWNNDELNEVVAKFLEQKQIKNFKISDIKLQINGVKIDPDKNVSID